MTDLDDRAGKTLRTFARTLFPFDRIGDEYYEIVVEKIRLNCKGPDLELVLSGLRDMAQSVGDFSELPEEQRVAYLKSIEATPFFKKVYGFTVREFFNNPALWPLFDYEGPSAHKGGFVKRGFDAPYGAPP
jgi:hypothetical protein